MCGVEYESPKRRFDLPLCRRNISFAHPSRIAVTLNDSLQALSGEVSLRVLVFEALGMDSVQYATRLMRSCQSTRGGTLLWSCGVGFGIFEVLLPVSV